MIITKDNLLRFVREQKYVTPTIISEQFDTSTMIASAALSELSKDKLLSISNLKFGSTPYYYDPRQKECLIELAKKQLNGYDKEAFLKIQEQQILNDATLSIQLRISMEKIKDFAFPLEIIIQEKNTKFWVWYLRNLSETKKQIMDVINGKNMEEKNNVTLKTKVSRPKNIRGKTIKTPQISKHLNLITDEKIQKGEPFIESFFKDHYLNLDNKNKNEKRIKYEVSLKVRKITIHFDCVYYLKKLPESELLKYYASTPKPKIIFIENPSKKLIKLSLDLENLEVIEI